MPQIPGLQSAAVNKINNNISNIPNPLEGNNYFGGIVTSSQPRVDTFTGDDQKTLRKAVEDWGLAQEKAIIERYKNTGFCENGFVTKNQLTKKIRNLVEDILNQYEANTGELKIEIANKLTIDIPPIPNGWTVNIVGDGKLGSIDASRADKSTTINWKVREVGVVKLPAINKVTVNIQKGICPRIEVNPDNTELFLYGQCNLSGDCSNLKYIQVKDSSSLGQITKNPTLSPRCTVIFAKHSEEGKEEIHVHGMSPEQQTLSRTVDHYIEVIKRDLTSNANGGNDSIVDEDLELLRKLHQYRLQLNTGEKDEGALEHIKRQLKNDIDPYITKFSEKSNSHNVTELSWDSITAYYKALEDECNFLKNNTPPATIKQFVAISQIEKDLNIIERIVHDFENGSLNENEIQPPEDYTSKLKSLNNQIPHLHNAILDTYQKWEPVVGDLPSINKLQDDLAEIRKRRLELVNKLGQVPQPAPTELTANLENIKSLIDSCEDMLQSGPGDPKLPFVHTRIAILNQDLNRIEREIA